MAKIFISYRREDTQYQADLLHRSLGQYFENPSEDIFIDVDNIPVGVDFVEYLDEQVRQCELLLVLIGDRWLEAKDPETGERRLNDPDDFVRIEIRSALNRGIPVVPVTFDDARVPKTSELPDDLKALARRNGAPINRLSFDADVDRLLRALPAPSMAKITKQSPIGVKHEEVETVSAANAGPSAAPRIIRIDLPNVVGWPNPEMVVLQPGEFLMGAPDEDDDGRDWERPLHKVAIARPFALGRTPITFAAYDAFCDHQGVAKPDDEGEGRDQLPVFNVSWNEALSFIEWLNRQLGLRDQQFAYRLPAEAEWEFACRAGTTTAYSFGSTFDPKKACINHKRDPVGSYPANPWGIYDMHGNVSEWCADAWHENYNEAPNDGSVWEGGDASRRVLRSASGLLAISKSPRSLRSASRHKAFADRSNNSWGFRIARTLQPE